MKLEELITDYKKYRWFFTSSDKLVVGGKSAEQNDELLRKLKNSGKDFFVMHTSTPGSPFSVILADRKKVNGKDMDECAIFTGCFSREWRSGKERATIDIFSLSQLNKNKEMKAGMWRVKGDIKKRVVKLELVLTRQKNILRAVPAQTVRKKEILLHLKPGKIDKREMLSKFQVILPEGFKEEEMLSALPSGGISSSKK